MATSWALYARNRRLSLLLMWTRRALDELVALEFAINDDGVEADDPIRELGHGMRGALQVLVADLSELEHHGVGPASTGLPQKQRPALRVVK